MSDYQELLDAAIDLDEVTANIAEALDLPLGSLTPMQMANELIRRYQELKP